MYLYDLSRHYWPFTFVILPPLKFAKRLSERVSTLALRWIVNLFEAVTIFLHLKETNIQLVGKKNHTETLKLIMVWHLFDLLGAFVSIFAIQLFWLDKLLQSFGDIWSSLYEVKERERETSHSVMQRIHSSSVTLNVVQLP